MLKISVFIFKNKTTMKSISNLLFCSSYLKINRNKIESYRLFINGNQSKNAIT